MFDNIDKQIIEILQREGRITMTELGRGSSSPRRR
jgi:hypothetical protein